MHQSVKVTKRDPHLLVSVTHIDAFFQLNQICVPCGQCM